jgi:hexosaminidase
VEVLVSNNAKDFTPVGFTNDFNARTKGVELGTMKVELKSTNARYVKVAVKNWGDIPGGNPGEGNKAWLFVDEIEVN